MSSTCLVNRLCTRRNLGAYSRHRHWKAVYNKLRVEGFENKTGDQAVVNSGVFVLLEFWKLVLANVDHFSGDLLVYLG